MGKLLCWVGPAVLGRTCCDGEFRCPGEYLLCWVGLAALRWTFWAGNDLLSWKGLVGLVRTCCAGENMVFLGKRTCSAGEVLLGWGEHVVLGRACCTGKDLSRWEGPVVLGRSNVSELCDDLFCWSLFHDLNHEVNTRPKLQINQFVAVYSQ